MIRKCTYFLLYCIHCSLSAIETTDVVTKTAGLVAFWDFVKREPNGLHRFTAHVPDGNVSDYPLDAINYVKEYWNLGPVATYADFPQMGRGLFGNAIRIKNETSINVRPLLSVSRENIHNTPLDIKGSDKSLTMVAWVIRESGNHAIAGVWNEGTDILSLTGPTIKKVEPGHRQYALFAGLQYTGTSTGHLSENGVGSFLNAYALHKSHTANFSPQLPATSASNVLDTSWQCFAMSFDHKKKEITSWLNGVTGQHWLINLQNDVFGKACYNAYMQGYFAKLPGKQEGEDESYPKDQYYNPPEGTPVLVRVLSQTANERVEAHDFRYTRLRITIRDGVEVSRDLVGISANPWWYPHPIYSPIDMQRRSEFTIGRVVHSQRTVGFTGWIGGVAIYDRALSIPEIRALSNLRSATPIPTPTVAIAPSITPAVGNYQAPITISIENHSPGTTLRYTTDGTRPSATVGIVYSSPFKLNSTTTLKVIATGASFVPSQVISYTYFISQPALSGWRTLHGLPPDGSQDLSNPSSDGVVNLLKMAFNMAPNAGDLLQSNTTVLATNGKTGLPRVGKDNLNRLTVSFVRLKDAKNRDITYNVLTGEDLANLLPLDLKEAHVEDIDTDWERVTVSDPTVTTKRFGCVRVASASSLMETRN